LKELLSADRSSYGMNCFQMRTNSMTVGSSNGG
jgi:hypothetical protein